MSIPLENEKALDVLSGTGKKVVVGGQEFEIRPFVLRNRIKFVKTVSEIVMSVGSKIDSEVQSHPERAIPVLLEAAGEKVVEIYALVLGKDEQWCQENVTMRNEYDIWEAVLEVNDVPFILRRVQEALPKNLTAGK